MPTIADDHHSGFLKIIAESANVKPEQLIDLDLYLFDAQPAVCSLCILQYSHLQALTGLYDEFISGARLDNLGSYLLDISQLMDYSSWYIHMHQGIDRKCQRRKRISIRSEYSYSCLFR